MKTEKAVPISKALTALEISRIKSGLLLRIDEIDLDNTLRKMDNLKVVSRKALEFEFKI